MILFIDFDVDLDLSSSDAPTELYFVSAYHSYPCDLHKEESDENSMACYTRYSFSSCDAPKTTAHYGGVKKIFF